MRPEATEQFFSFADVRRALARNWRLVAAIWGAVLATTLLGAVFLPPVYQATARVLISAPRASVPTNPAEPAQLERNSDVREGEFSSQLEIIASYDLVRSTLVEMGIGLDREPEGWVSRVLGAPMRVLRSAGAWLRGETEAERQDDFLYAATQGVLQALAAAPVGKSNVVEVSLTWPDPVWARDFVNRHVDRYLDRHAELQRVSGAQDFFADQSEFLKKKLTDSEGRLKALREEAGTVSGQQTQLEERLKEFDNELARTIVEREAQEQQVAYLEGEQTGRSGPRLATPKLLELEATRAEMIGRYKPNSQRMRDLDRQIVAMRQALGRYDGVIGDGIGTAEATDLVASRAKLASLRGKERALRTQRDRTREELSSIQASTFDLVRLERQVKVDEEAYLAYVRAAEQSRLSSALDQSRLLRLSVLERAERPREPAGPLRGRLLLMGLLGGLAVGCAAALARDYFDESIKSAADVERYGKTEVLTVIRRAG